MRGQAHALIGAAAAAPLAAAAGQAGLLVLAGGVIGGLMPDADHPESLLGRWLPWPSVWEGWRVGRWRPGGVVWHRGECHSVGAAVIVSLLALAGAAGCHDWLAPGAIMLSALGVLVGYLSHLGADLLSPSPQMLLWPCSRKHLRPEWLPAARVDSGAGRALEHVASAAATLALIWVARTALHEWIGPIVELTRRLVEIRPAG